MVMRTGVRRAPHRIRSSSPRSGKRSPNPKRRTRPSEATAMSKRHPNRRQAAYQQLQATFPRVFPQDDAELRPLALSIRDEVAAWIHRQGLEERAARAVLSALQHHCSRRTYQQGVAAGGMRINLQGEPIEPVTPEGQAHAHQRIAQILASREARPRPAPARRAPAQAASSPKAKANMPESTPAPVKSTQALPTVIVKKRRQVVIPPLGER